MRFSIVVALALLLGCGVEPLPTPEPFAWNPNAPVTGESQRVLSEEEVREVTGRYAAANLWVHVARETAENRPGEFARALFTAPPRECVEARRDRMLETPDPPISEMLECAAQELESQDPGNWDKIHSHERETLVRRGMVNLFTVMDPPTRMTVKIALERTVEVTPQNSPNFARFAAHYDDCERMKDWYGDLMLTRETQYDLAQAWLEAEVELQACFNRATQEAFVTTEDTGEN